MKDAVRKRRILFVSGQDYRSKRRVNVHHICEAISQSCDVKFFSLGYSVFSRIKGRDPRIELEDCANSVGSFQGVECFFWKSALHPFRIGAGVFSLLDAIFFEAYRSVIPTLFRNWVEWADLVVVESGIGVVVLDLVKSISPHCRLAYVASDDLETIHASSFLSSLLIRSAGEVDFAAVPSDKMRTAELPFKNVQVIEHGLDPAIYDPPGPSPYRAGLNAVSVGSMLFDLSFFRAMAPKFPDVMFHVIGSGVKAVDISTNVIFYPEMPYRDTLDFVRHASFGIAPYASEDDPEYLSDTSMKLMQFCASGVPAVCPNFAVGKYEAVRFGYRVGDILSMADSVRRAILCDRFVPYRFGGWTDVARRLLLGAFAD